MRTDTRRERFMLWLADRVPFGLSMRLRWRVQDNRLDRAMRRREQASEALRAPPRRR